MTRLLTKEDIVGIFPPLASPFTADEEVDVGALREELRYNLSLGVTGVCLGGSTGEGHALDANDMHILIKTAVEEVKERIPVMAGIISTSVRDAVKRGKAARDAGAQALMVTPPIYQLPSEQGMYDYFDAIHRETGLPIVIYNVLPHCPVTPALFKRLADHPGIIGTKESIGGSLETLTELLETVGDKISVTWAHDWLLYPGFAIGATGSISGAAAILPKHCIALWNAVQGSDIKTAQKLHFIISDVTREISKLNWPAGTKLAINMQGRKVGPCRRPFTKVPEEQAERIRAALERANAVDLDKLSA
ncbi:dihydrodipicolinate synthase family protein [Burkholderia multivorans]|uniref:dihydrodipicolinate synthase family protein n=1 Tax=Burkholderia multivorans TaxID=87883 RepID=UPI002ED014E7|nr:dihydrodipicolinate synthase family protein [Burkholderia multivorans]